MNAETGPTPRRIYIASLADYNAGRLLGAWIDVTDDPADIHAGISEVLASSPEPDAEEWAIHDYEGFGPWRLHEWQAPEQMATAARGIDRHGMAFAYWLDYLSLELDPDASDSELDETFTSDYLGEWDSLEDFARSLIADYGVTISVEPARWQHYAHLDVEAMARDLAIDLYAAETPDNTVHVFQP